MTTINIRMDSELKKNFEEFCSNVGMNMTTAFTLFANTVVRQQKIPFEIASDSFYNPANQERLIRAVQDMNDGKNVAEHELIIVE